MNSYRTKSNYQIKAATWQSLEIFTLEVFIAYNKFYLIDLQTSTIHLNSKTYAYKILFLQ